MVNTRKRKKPVKDVIEDDVKHTGAAIRRTRSRTIQQVIL